MQSLAAAEAMTVHLRIARPVRNLWLSARMYMSGLELEERGRFVNHAGFDGVMLGCPGSPYHLEFTFCATHMVVPSPTPEDLLVFYFPQRSAWERTCRSMTLAGFQEVRAFNPYWERLGRTFEDPDGYRTVIQREHAEF
jgi:hypothetical protein